MVSSSDLQLHLFFHQPYVCFSCSVKLVYFTSSMYCNGFTLECLINCFKFLFYNNLASFMHLLGTLSFFLSYHKRNKAKLHSVPSVLCWHAAYAEKGYWQIFQNISERILEAIRIHRWFFYSCRREAAGTIHVGLVTP